MNEKPVPEFMRRYMENIGHDCFVDYDRLSKEYHAEVNRYHEKVHPGKVEIDSLYRRAGGSRGNFDAGQRLQEIEETYKAKALDLACKYGYEQPEKTRYDYDFTALQERGAFRRVVERNNFGLSYQDVRANQAHKHYEAKHPKSKEQRKLDRDFIDQYYGEGRNEKHSPEPKAASRYMDSLSSEKEKANRDIDPASRPKEQGKDFRKPEIDKSK